MTSTMRVIHGQKDEETFSYLFQHKNARRIAHLLRFPGEAIDKFKKESIDTNKYSLSYDKGSNWIKRNPKISQLHHYVEGPHSLVLYYDNKPLCNVSYTLMKEAILIHQLQGVRYDYGRKDKEGFPKKTDNFELNKFEWSKVLVTLIEELAMIKGKQYVYIQPSAYNVAWGARGESGERVYDFTAIGLGYAQEVSAVIALLPTVKDGKRVFKKRSTVVYKKKIT